MVELNETEWDMLQTLWNLRYLTSEHLHRGWYGPRTVNALRVRLSTLHKAELVQRVSVGQERLRWAWRIGRSGLERLSEHLGTDLRPYQDLSPVFVPHLIETNDIFFVLGSGKVSMENLPFTWSGSHRALLPFVEMCRDPETDVVRRRDRLLRPDAIVVPKHASSRRIFVELDRGTEAIASKTGRTNIHAKLRAYRTFLLSRSAEGPTWYTKTFADSRSAAVIFVVPTSTRQSQRKASVLAAIAHLDLEFRKAFTCVTADEHDAIRAFCELGPRAKPWTPPPVRPTPSLDAMREFYRISLEAYRRLHPESSVRPKFNEAAKRVHAQLFPQEESRHVAISDTPSASH